MAKCGIAIAFEVPMSGGAVLQFWCQKELHHEGRHCSSGRSEDDQKYVIIWEDIDGEHKSSNEGK